MYPYRQYYSDGVAKYYNITDKEKTRSKFFLSKINYTCNPPLSFSSQQGTPNYEFLLSLLIALREHTPPSAQASIGLLTRAQSSMWKKKKIRRSLRKEIPPIHKGRKMTFSFVPDDQLRERVLKELKTILAKPSNSFS